MKILLLLPFLALMALVSAKTGHTMRDSNTPEEISLSNVKRLPRRQARKACRPYVYVVQYPVKGVRLQQAHDDTDTMARSYYNKFSIREYAIHDSNSRPRWSQFQVAIEHKTPKQEPSGEKQVKINFYNLLFTASLRMTVKDNECREELTLIGFVELVKTDMTWYKGRHNITEYRQSNLVSNNQYVMTKLIPGDKLIFANSTSSGRTIVRPINQKRVVPLKYESAENIVVDFEKHRDTIQYERLIEKKIFLVQTDLNNKVLEVTAGVDVLMYLDLVTYNFTDVPHLSVNTNHSLIRRIADPQKYINVINKLDAEAIRQEPSDSTYSPWSSIFSTLDPIPKGIHIYTD